MPPVGDPIGSPKWTGEDLPEADALEQSAEVVEPGDDDQPGAAPAHPPVRREPLVEADEGDLAEQAFEVPLDEDDDRA